MFIIEFNEFNELYVFSAFQNKPFAYLRASSAYLCVTAPNQRS